MLVPHATGRSSRCQTESPSRAAVGPLVDLAADECWELAASRPVGRLAWTGAHGRPTVIPVNFTVDGRSVHVRTAAYSAAARECDDSPVAFEIDNFDEAERSGWSVLMRGHAHLDFAAPEPADRRPRCLGGRHTEPPAAGRRRGDHGPADPPRRLRPPQDCGCLVAKIAAWVRLVSPAWPASRRRSSSPSSRRGTSARRSGGWSAPRRSARGSSAPGRSAPRAPCPSAVRCGPARGPGAVTAGSRVDWPAATRRTVSTKSLPRTCLRM